MTLPGLDWTSLCPLHPCAAMEHVCPLVEGSGRTFSFLASLSRAREDSELEGLLLGVAPVSPACADPKTMRVCTVCWTASLHINKHFVIHVDPSGWGLGWEFANGPAGLPPMYGDRWGCGQCSPAGPRCDQPRGLPVTVALAESLASPLACEQDRTSGQDPPASPQMDPISCSALGLVASACSGLG